MNSTDRYDSLFEFYGERNKIDAKLLKAQVRAESDFDPMARSNAGACGLAQFMPQTFTEWSIKLRIHSPNPFNPEHSIQCQAAYMRWLLDQFAGNLDRAIGSYNFGVGREQRRDSWPHETIQYVEKVKAYLKEYETQEEILTASLRR